MLELYQKIKFLREQLNMSQDELAKKTGYTSRTSIAKIEAGKIDLPQSKISLFADALNTTVADLMGWGPEENTPAGTSESQLSGAMFRLAKELEPYNLTEEDTDFLLTVFKAHKERNK